MGNSPSVCRRHHEEVVRQSYAARFWALRPSADGVEKIVPLTVNRYEARVPKLVESAHRNRRRPIFWRVTICLALLTNLHARAVVIDESLTGGGTMTEYSVLNQSQLSATQFDISAFTIATTGIGPTTTNLNWSSQALNSNSWSSIAMGGTNPNEPLTWQQYTGMTWNQAFPNNPFKVNGYFLSYIWNSGAQTVSYPSNPFFPGNPFKGGFFFQGTPSSDFLRRWRQYTGKMWNQAFPQDPIKVNGYFLSYIWNSGAQTVTFPNAPLFPTDPMKGGFFFQAVGWRADSPGVIGGNYSASSSATRRARFSDGSFSGESEPTKFVNLDFGKLTNSSQWMLLACFSPSSCPTATCVDSPSCTEYMGAQTTVEKRK